MKKFYMFCGCVAFILLSGCKINPQQTIVMPNNVVTAKIEAPEKLPIHTSEGARSLDLEAPLRCSVNWNAQQIITTIPFNVKAFNLVRNGRNDMLPRYEVNGFSFETMPAEKALYKLLKEADIRVIAKDAPYASISAENLRGELAEVVKMIAEAAEIYYNYDAENKTLRISRKSNFSLYIPQSRPILLSVLDVLRGAGITDITTDWEDYTISFDADYELQNKIMTLIAYFEDNPVLVAFDVSIFRIYPNGGTGEINWQNMLNIFDYGTIRTAKTGVIGRVLTASNDINIQTLQNYLGRQARVEMLSQGKLTVPNLWLSRFDIGKCGPRGTAWSDLSILAKASLEQGNKIFSHITLEKTEGQITQFNIRSKIGDNFVIIGIPNEIFGVGAPKSETLVFMVPRIIRTTKTTKHLEYNL